MDTINNKRDNIDTELIALFKEFYDKQEMVEKKAQAPFIREYSYTELHTIDEIGKNELPNVSMVASNLHLTRGAVSKITKRLLKKGDIERFQLDTNKKEVYFRLTDQGEKIFDAHKESHSAWENSDLDFFENMKKADKEKLHSFLTKYLNHLDNRLAKSQKVD